MKALVLGRQGKEGQWGFTLVELMVAIVLSTLVMLGGGELLRQMIVASTHNADETIALIQVQNAGFWVGQDAVQAQAVECFDPATDDPKKRLLTLSWTAWDLTDHVVTYSMVDTADEVGQPQWMLMRHDNISDETVMISEFLDPAGTSCAWDGVSKVLTLNVKATVFESTETRAFEVRPRSFE